MILQSHGPLGISEDVFMSWLMKEPQLLVWLSTLYRLKAAEKGTVIQITFFTVNQFKFYSTVIYHLL